MSPSLQQDLKQKKPFRSLQQEAYLSVVRTSTALTDAMEDLVKARGISATQYNVLRILRGSGAEGLCRNALRDRMLTRMPDMTRLLDRMEDAGVIVRMRDPDDRRHVTARITAAGRKRLADATPELERTGRARTARLSPAEIAGLIRMLAAIREQL